jgi:GntR family transcriptional regulator
MREASKLQVVMGESPPTRFSTRPLYLQVRDAIAQRIAEGEWKPHIAIPNENELAREFGVSPGTMRKALDLAEAERLITRRQGRGTFVNDQSSDEHAARYSNIRSRDGKRISGNVTVLGGFETTVSELNGMRLRLRAHERVYSIRRLWSTDGKPYMLEDVALPAKLFPGLAIPDDAHRNIAVLAQQFGILLGGSEERITSHSAADDVISALQVASGASVMCLDRVIYTLQGVPVEWSLAQCLIEEDRYYLAQFR